MLHAHLGTALEADVLGALGFVAQRVDAHAQRALGGQGARNAALELLRGLADERGVVDEAVLGRVVLGLEGAEERLFRAEDLDGGGGHLGKLHQRAGVGDEAGTDELADEDGEVGRNGGHPGFEVIVQLRAVLGQRNHLGKLDVCNALGWC